MPRRGFGKRAVGVIYRGRNLRPLFSRLNIKAAVPRSNCLGIFFIHNNRKIKSEGTKLSFTVKMLRDRLDEMERNWTKRDFNRLGKFEDQEVLVDSFSKSNRKRYNGFECPNVITVADCGILICHDTEED